MKSGIRNNKPGVSVMIRCSSPELPPVSGYFFSVKITGSIQRLENRDCYNIIWNIGNNCLMDFSI